MTSINSTHTTDNLYAYTHEIKIESKSETSSTSISKEVSETGDCVEIHLSEEARTMLSVERQAKEKAIEEMEAETTVEQNNRFSSRDYFTKQYEIFSDFFRSSGLYDELNEDEVSQIESLLKEITADMNAVNIRGKERGELVRANILCLDDEITQAMAQISLVSSTSALRALSSKYVSEDKKDGFEQLVNDYVQHNSERITGYRSGREIFNEIMATIPPPTEIVYHKNYEEIANRSNTYRELGSVTHTADEKQAFYEAIQSIINSSSGTEMIDLLRATLFTYQAGENASSQVMEYLEKHTANAFNTMANYWEKLNEL